MASKSVSLISSLILSSTLMLAACDRPGTFGPPPTIEAVLSKMPANARPGNVEWSLESRVRANEWGETLAGKRVRFTAQAQAISVNRFADGSADIKVQIGRLPVAIGSITIQFGLLQLDPMVGAGVMQHVTDRMEADRWENASQASTIEVDATIDSCQFFLVPMLSLSTTRFRLLD